MLHRRTLRLSILLSAAGALVAARADAQATFVKAPAQIPPTGSYTENVDYGDIDRDGDWDVLVADGGDGGNDQNRCYVNIGLLQGGTIGFFVDDPTRMPLVSDDSRDIEFADIDGDGDIDAYTSNTAQLSNQTNRWLVNVGGKQGQVEGFYVDETTSRWVGVGGPGSSVPASSVLGSGGFIDWSCDSDFADLDNDGDLDLVHSTYGGSFVGNSPSRVFLNDGGGFFAEFNPSGFQLTTATITNGDPALWCDGLFQNGTTDTTGAFGDITNSALGIELADKDGDLDIDVLHGSRNTQPRMFRNTLEENGGTQLGFRDVTGAPGTPGAAWSVASSGSDNYEQELGDVDRDGDVDAYMLNYVGLSDNAFNNPGTGEFNGNQQLVSSGNDDNEVDFLDYDADGDLDVTVAAFASFNRLYRNEYAGGGSGTATFTLVASASSGFTTSRSLDSDCADVDADGDTDVMTAEDANQHEILYVNALGVEDAWAPYFGAGSAPVDATSAAGDLPVRRQVYDNAPYYVAWYTDVRLAIWIDGCRIPYIPARSSQGQIFRALLPKNLQGAVGLRWRASDEYGNTADSPEQSYLATSSLAFESHFGVATAGAGGTPTLNALSVPFAGTKLHLGIGPLPSGTSYWIAVTDQKLVAPLPLPGLFTLDVAGNVLTVQGSYVDQTGCGFLSLPVPASVPAGVKVYAQGVGLDGTGGNLFSATDGLEITTQ